MKLRQMIKDFFFHKPLQVVGVCDLNGGIHSCIVECIDTGPTEDGLGKVYRNITHVFRTMSEEKKNAWMQKNLYNEKLIWYEESIGYTKKIIPGALMSMCHCGKLIQTQEHTEKPRLKILGCYHKTLRKK